MMQASHSAFNGANRKGLMGLRLFSVLLAGGFGRLIYRQAFSRWSALSERIGPVTRPGQGDKGIIPLCGEEFKWTSVVVIAAEERKQDI
jgi:hypothetical protein